jgi:TPR repeat protein
MPIARDSLLLVVSATLACGTPLLAEPGRGFDDSRTSLKGGTVSREDAARVAEHRRNAAAGDSGAQTLLGLMYQTGQGVPRNEIESARWFRRAAEANECAGQYHLGLLYLQGRGVPVDIERAAHWLRRAQDHLLEIQQSSFRSLYVGIVELARAASAPFESEVEIEGDAAVAPLRDPDSLYRRGSAYLEGAGVPTDAAHAIRFFRMAANDGHTAAQLELGRAYGAGKGVRVDRVRAHQWLNISAAGGSGAARRELAQLEAELSEAQVAEAEFLAAEWRRRHGW